MKLSLEDIKKIIVSELESDPDATGWRFYGVVANLVEREKLCVRDVERALAQLTAERYQLRDGREFVPSRRVEILLSEDYGIRAYAHKNLHTGELNCVH